MYFCLKILDGNWLAIFTLFREVVDYPFQNSITFTKEYAMVCSHCLHALKCHTRWWILCTLHLLVHKQRYFAWKNQWRSVVRLACGQVHITWFEVRGGGKKILPHSTCFIWSWLVHTPTIQDGIRGGYNLVCWH